MQTISINLSDALGDFVQRQAAEHGIDAYFATILRDQQRDELETELVKGIESGFGEPITPEYWQKIREAGKQRLAQQKGKTVYIRFYEQFVSI